MAKKEFLGYAGLQTFYNLIMDLLSEKFIYGRETVVLSEASSGSYTTKALNLPFTPNNNTKIIATLSKRGAPNPFFCYTLTLARMSSQIYAVISRDSGSGETVSSGTYYIDWLVLDKGEG